MAIGQSMESWGTALAALLGENTQGRAYYLVEFAAILFGFTACGLMWKKTPILAIYSLLTIVFSMTSGVAQGMHRYMMAAPVIFMLPARWGQNSDLPPLFGPLLMLDSPPETAPARRSTMLELAVCSQVNYAV